MNGSVYIETTIPSFYYEVRSNPEMVARRHWTRQWWDEHRQRYESVTSAAAVDELQRGEYGSRNDTLALIAELPLLAVDQAVSDIVSAYITHQVMPADPAGDALHLALASLNRCDFLLT